jgi:hypothetical protein
MPGLELWTVGVQFALSLVFSGRECNLLILTLPESAKGRVKSTPDAHPNAPLPLHGFSHKPLWADFEVNFSCAYMLYRKQNMRNIHAFLVHLPLEDSKTLRKK